jgi:hypothetical protein
MARQCARSFSLLRRETIATQSAPRLRPTARSDPRNRPAAKASFRHHTKDQFTKRAVSALASPAPLHFKQS